MMVLSISLLLTACSTVNPPSIFPANPVAINWKNIDGEAKLPVENFRKSLIDDPKNFAIPTISKQYGISEIQAQRILILQSSLESEALFKAIKQQLGDNLASIYWDFGSLGTQNSHFSDQEAVQNFKIMVITKPTIKAETHYYTYQLGNAKGYGIPIQILPIATRSEAEIVSIYGNDKLMIKVTKLIATYGGELIGAGFSPIGYKTTFNIYFPKGKPNEATLEKLNQELSQLTDLDTNIRVSLTRLIL